MNWKAISLETVTESFMKEHIEKLDWNHLIHHAQIPETVLSMLGEKNIITWYSISANQNLSEPFIERHKDQLDWYYLSAKRYFSKPFINKMKEYIHWGEFSIHHTLSEEIIREFDEYVDFNYGIPARQQLSETFMEEYKEELDWFHVSENQKLTLPFIQKHIARVYIQKLEINPQIELSKEEWKEIKELKQNTFYSL